MGNSQFFYSYCKVYWITGMLILCGQMIRAQPVQVTRIEGLPESTCNAVTRDHYGFIWIGTTSGLIRYDASSFLTFNTTSKPALKGSDIKSILARHDSLWIASTAAVEIFDLKTFTVTSFAIPLPVNDYIIRLHGGNDNSVWLASDFGYLYHWSKGQLVLMQAPPLTHDWLKAPHNSVIAMGSNHAGFWWSRLDGNLFVLEKQKPKLLFRADTLKSKGLSMLGTNGTLWYASNDYFLGRNRKGKLIHFGKKGEAGFLLANRAVSYAEDDAQNIWLAGISGNVIRINREGSVSAFLTGVQSIGSSPVNGMFIDSQGLLWMASPNGLYQTQTKRGIEKTILTSNTDKKISTRKILQDEKGDIYIGTYSGLFRTTSTLTGNPERIELKKLNGNTIVVYDMVNDPHGFLWIAAEGDGLLLFNKKTNEITSLNKLNRKGFAQRYFISLLRDTSGLFWIGGYEGLITFDTDSKQFSVFKNETGDSVFYNQKIFDFEESKDGTIWVGSEKGLYKISPGTRVTTKIELGNQLPESVPVRTLLFDSKGLLWLGTKSAGLISIDFVNEKTSVFTVADGLANNTVNEILEDPQKNALWLSTDNGLSRLAFGDYRFQNFSKANGLSCNELNHKSALLTRENKLIFGGVDGISVLDPLAVDDDSVTTPLQLVSYSKYDAVHDSITTTQTHGNVIPVQLAYNDRMFSVQFRLLNFETPAENKYAYRIEGLMNPSWTYLGTQNSLLLNSLDAGDYTLLIRGAGRDGRWSSAVLKIPVHVKQAFYKTWWFLASCVCMLAGLGYLAHVYRVRQVLRIERVRTRIARDLHDELGSSLTSIGIYSDLANNQTDGNQKHIAQIGSLSREAAATLRDIVWAIDSKDDTLESLLLRLRDLMHQMLEVKGITCEVSKFNVRDKIILPAFVKQHVYLIFKEGINNIARHAEATHVEMKIEMDVESLRMELVNNGIRTGKNEHSPGGNGLRNMQSRTETMSGNLSITTEENFSICLTLPLHVLHPNGYER